MQFKNLLYDSPAAMSLKHAVVSGSVPHALLFWGGEGTGKLAMALTLAQYVLCLDPQSDEPCRVCRSCTKSFKLIHPDLHFMFPTVGTKALSTQFYPKWRESVLDNPYLNLYQWLLAIGGENKQGNIPAVDCLRVIEQLSLKSFEADTKILIIWMAEMLGKEGNRLLKIIEEPPENTLILLVAEKRDEILPTILSRCQQIFFKPLNEDLVQQRLISRGLTPGRAARVAAAAGGNWNEALRLAAGTNEAPVDLLAGWIRAAYRQIPAEILQQADVLGRLPKADQKLLLRYSTKVVEKALKKRYGLEVEGEEKEMKIIKFLAERLGVQQMEQLIDEIDEQVMTIERNANTRIQWMYATLVLKNALYHPKEEVSRVGVS